MTGSEEVGWDFFALLILDAVTHLCTYHLEYLQKSHVHLVMGKRNSEDILKTDQPTNSLDSICPQEVSFDLARTVCFSAF